MRENGTRASPNGATAAGRICVDVLGPLRVRIGETTVDRAALGGQKPRQLLGVLALARGAPVGKERLADLLWGEHQPVHVAGTLATYVSHLRHRAGLSTVLESRGTTCRLDTTRVRLDLDEFDGAVLAAKGQPPQRARLHLDRALALVRDELLVDEPYAEWVEPDRSRYRRRHVEVLVAAAEAALACRDLDAGTALAERALRVDPIDERAARAFVLGLHGLGRRGAALQWHERFVQRLRTELSVQPAAALQDLADAVRRGEPAAALLPPVPPEVRPRLTDIAPPGVPFLGRAAELAALTQSTASLREGCNGLVLVEGETGMGKTRLVRELATRVDVPVGAARCYQSDRRLPYAALLRALRDTVARDMHDPVSELVGDVLSDSDAAHERRVLPALGRLVDEHGPVVVVLDDAHWADRPSLMALHHLACLHPVLAIATVRPRVMALRHPLPLLEPVLRVPLAALTPAELDPVDVPGLHDETAGVPLLVAEWLDARARGQLLELPRRLAPWADEEARRAGAPARDLLAAAAALDRDIALCELAPVLGPVSLPVVDAVEHLCNAGLVRERGGRYALSCHLVREICRSVLFPVRVRLLAELLQGSDIRVDKETTTS